MDSLKGEMRSLWWDAMIAGRRLKRKTPRAVILAPYPVIIMHLPAFCASARRVNLLRLADS